MKRPIQIEDPFQASADESMPQLALALDAERARKLLKRGLPRLLPGGQILRLKAIRVVRHKPGKRCVIEFDVFIEPPTGTSETFTILGKIRAHRYGNTGFRLQEAFWESGFDDRSADNISVPEPLGVIPELQMWFQRKIPARTASMVLDRENRPELASRIAEAAVKIHQASVPPSKKHSLDDELGILHDCFLQVAQRRPEWGTRLEELFARCRRTSEALGDRPATGIHRDFYADQILFSGDRLFVIDFDLYCEGDPALDIGNFSGHLIEQGLRIHGRADALQKARLALEERFLELSGRGHSEAVDLYRVLTLARHIFLSTQFPERTHLTEPLLQLCETQLH